MNTANKIRAVCAAMGVWPMDARRALSESRWDVEAAKDLIRRNTPMRGGRC